MSLESICLVEHFDFIKKVIPQPFVLKCEDVISLTLNPETEMYVIKTKQESYEIARNTLKKLVDALGVKVKLLSSVSDSEADVYDLILPALNKLFKCFADCFVFYHTSEDPNVIIDLNVNAVRGPEGTKYENGPSPWKIDVGKNPEMFTCFANFMESYTITDADTNILLKADDVYRKNKQVVLNLFKLMSGNILQPMLTFSSKFSNMSGFTEIHPSMYDTEHDIMITLPMNYGNTHNPDSFSSMWNKTLHIYETTDLDDFIFREVNTLAASDEAPMAVKNFISNILTESTLNINQPIKDILNEASRVGSQMKPAKKRKFFDQLGCLIGFALVMKHDSCSECGHMHL